MKWTDVDQARSDASYLVYIESEDSVFTAVTKNKTWGTILRGQFVPLPPFIVKKFTKVCKIVKPKKED